MKKIIQKLSICLSLVIGLTTNNFAQSWQNVGTAGFTADQSSYNSLAINSSGIPYMAFRDETSLRATVMKFDGTDWIIVGSAGFSAFSAEFTSLAFNSNDEPYIAFKEGGGGGTVMKFDGSNWVVVGGASFSSLGAGNSIDYTSIAFNSNDEPYVAYRENILGAHRLHVSKFDGSNWIRLTPSLGLAQAGSGYPSLAFSPVTGEPFLAFRDANPGNNKAVVLKFNGSNWITVGTGGIVSAGTAAHISLAFNAVGEPYVAYQDGANSNRTSVRKFNGTSWETVGSLAFSAGGAGYTSLAFNNNNEPHVAYQDAANSSNATVMKFNGVNWITVGAAGLSTGAVQYTSLAFDNNGDPYVAYSDVQNSFKGSVMKFTCSAQTGIDTRTACGSFTWIDGNTYTSSNNTATHTLAGGAANSCDSIVTLNLTISSSVTGTDIQTACNSFTWIDGNTYTTSNNTATYTFVNGSVNGCDSIVTLNLTINSPTTGTDIQTACNSYTWIDGNTYTTSNNTATHTIIGGAANGCDSTVTLNLTINNPTTGTDIQTACNSYTWIDGNTYTASNNTATHTIVGGAANGCDSTVTLNLTINNPTTGTDIQSACNSYTWIDGNTYTASNNTATHTIVGGAVNGCDSIVTLNLTINTPTTGTDNQTACNSYTWIDGNTYTSDNNTATHTIVGGAANGCDSTVTLNLTITTFLTGTDIVSACGSYTWIDGNTYTSNNNTATHTLQSAQGCDSIVTLNLTINQPSTGTDVITACGSYTWIDGNTYTTSNNAATHTLQNVNGCDSVVTLNLTINSLSTGTDVITACDSYTWINGTTYTSSNNTATHTLQNVNGCDSVVTLNLIINTVNNVISTTGNTLTANQNGASYQWIDCDNGNSPISGATAQSYTADVSGNYAVEITLNGCTEISACEEIIVVGLEDINSNTITVYPNPASHLLHIELNISSDISIINALGETVLSSKISQQNNTIDVSVLTPGLYMVRTQSGSTVKFIKE